MLHVVKTNCMIYLTPCCPGIQASADGRLVCW